MKRPGKIILFTEGTSHVASFWQRSFLLLHRAALQFRDPIKLSFAASGLFTCL